jgi:hypothetical protein
MGDEFNPTEEGHRIAREYLSKRGWAREWRETLNREVYAAVNREELEAKERRCDQMEEEAEEFISQQYEKWRHESSPQAKQVLFSLYEMLGQRKDLGFFASRIIGRLHREFPA